MIRERYADFTLNSGDINLRANTGVLLHGQNDKRRGYKECERPNLGKLRCL